MDRLSSKASINTDHEVEDTEGTDYLDSFVESMQNQTQTFSTADSNHASGKRRNRERSEKSKQQNVNVLATLTPARVVRHHMAHTDNPRVNAFAERFEAAVLFADISGFSKLAEKLQKELSCAANAAENLSAYVGQSLDKMVRLICSMGGDVIKFAGDAILCVFDVKQFGSDLYQATVCAVQVARDLLSLELGGKNVTLSVHCGVGCGEVNAFHVGGVKNRWEYVITGDPVEQIGSAEGDAGSGEVVISKQAHALIGYNVKGEVIKETGNYRVDEIHDRKDFPTRKIVLDELSTFLSDNSEAASAVTRMLRCYVPLPVLMAIESGQSLWVAELRIISTIFCRLIGLSFSEESDLALIHSAVKWVQTSIDSYEGILLRFIVDDKPVSAVRTHLCM